MPTPCCAAILTIVAVDMTTPQHESAIQLYLASTSPRRRELLNQIGVRHEVVAVVIDENPIAGERADNYVIRLAQAKAVAGKLACRGKTNLPVLGADTAVVVDDMILGKPANEAEGVAMLSRLAGRSHIVHTAVAIVRDEIHHYLLSTSTVSFRHITETEALAYWNSGEPADKAGGYAVQGLGAIFIARLEGSYSGVMGLPLYETAQLLRRCGITLLSPNNK